MIAYRSTLDGGGNPGRYTITIKENGVKTVLPGSAYLKYAYNYFNGNGNIYVGENVSILTRMCIEANNFPINVYIKGNTWRDIAVNRMFGTNNAYRKTVHFNSIFNNIFNRTYQQYSIVGSQNLEWTAMTNGFYNALYNVYCYNNYSG